jgi:transcription-repair coupling factor (superfamily II helicase)
MPRQTPLSPPMPSQAAEKIYWGNLHGSSMGLAIAHAAKLHNSLTVVITPDSLSAQMLEAELSFFTAEDGLEILSFPDWETLPYDHFSPHQDIVAQRLLTLYRLPQMSKGILCVPIATMMQRITPIQYINAHTLVLDVGQRLDGEQLRSQLERSGYRYVSQVMENGEFTVRGSIIDLFPAGTPFPLRIDLFDDVIDSIRSFDPDTQLSKDKLNQVRLLPAREFPLTEDAINLFRQNWRATFSGDASKQTLYTEVSQGITSPGIEYYLPLFFSATSSLYDYLPSDSLLIRPQQSISASEQFWSEIKQRYEQLRYDISRPVLMPEQLYLAPNQLFAHLKPFSQIQIQANVEQFQFATSPTQRFTIDSRAEHPFSELQRMLQTTQARVLICAETAGRREILLELLTKAGVTMQAVAGWQEFLTANTKVNLTIAPLEQGLNLQEPDILLITESELFGERIMQRRRRSPQRKVDSDAVIRNLVELEIGSPVVHVEHGVGRYLGLQTIQLEDYSCEFLTLEYANADKIYVPVASLHLINRYSGTDVEHAPLHKLGSGQWDKARRKAAERIRDVAAELLDIYARREARKGFSFNAPDDHYQAFAASFPFEETEDQQRAIEQVIADMTKVKPMDRLVCGDVGFGKTEVAIRAAFLAVQSGKQVAVLVPTTLLAQQHYDTFKNRFAAWPIVIDVSSRFRTAKEQKSIVERLPEGKIDILIGTHKLLQDKLSFKNLGLVIIDEEHRFGVRQKERFKALRAEVDVLTLTATPIPRTLNMALSGIRDLSIIATPPARRLSVKTFVRHRDNSLIREAVLREVLRGGQVYFLHNKVDTIGLVEQELIKLLPEAKIAKAHGQMPERELERVMSDFYHHRFNLLLCTTIIETGIDIPTANTIIMDRADHFGLAQLHQLRGRVGRSHHQAYAYLLIPDKNALTADAKKRLDAITSLEDLGAGFMLANHDLEIRGAGEFLGEEQSGQLQEIGFALYMEMLEQAVNALRAGKEPALDMPLHQGIEIDLQLSALIPEDYLPDVHQRLTLYKRIANAKDLAGLHELQVEMVDRFGLLPVASKNLFQLAELKLQAKSLKIQKIEAGKTAGRILFEPEPKVDPMQILKLIQTQPQHYKLDGQDKLRFIFPMEQPKERLEVVTRLLASLSQKS